MSSIRDIMDVDVDPLESQALQRSRASAAATSSQLPAASSSSSGQSTITDTKGKAPISHNNNRRKSARVSKTSSKEATSSTRRRSNSGASMDSHSYSATSSQAGPSTTRSASRSNEPMELPVKYTPVTGRVSRAKKGLAVHNCDQCHKVFTRAEHLRRHQLSHQKPSYPCTFQDCERVFHRPDLLARHLNRHETQGEKPWKASSTQSHSRSPSTASENRSSNVKSEESFAPNEQMMPSRQEPQMPPGGSYQAIGGSFSPVHQPYTGPQEHLGQSSQAPPNDSMTYSMMDPTMGLFNNTDPFGTTTPPTLIIPTEYGQFYSSSDSTYSTPSSVTSRYGNAFGGRGRSASLATNPDFTSWSPPVTTAPLQTQVPRGIENIPESYGYMSPMSPLNSSTHMVSLDGGFEVVGTPTTLSTFHKSYSQSFPAPESPVRNERMGLLDGGQKILLDSHRLEMVSAQLGMPSIAEQVRSHLSVYWHRFDPIIPIVHPSTFDPIVSPVLTLSMAALGTQFSNRPEDRVLGTDLHTRAKRMIKEFPSWDLNTMRAILLTEVFGRFRSQVIDVRPSKVFKEMFSRFSNEPEGPEIFTRLNADTLSYATLTGTESVEQTSLWLQWTRYETRQRLKAACFMFDMSQGMYFEQQLIRPGFKIHEADIAFPCMESLWRAHTEEEWREIVMSQDCTSPLLSTYLNATHTNMPTVPQSRFADNLALASLASLVPGRDLTVSATLINNNAVLNAIDTRFSDSQTAHMFLLLKHTPLKDILAVTGDTWVLGRKTTSASEFHAIAPRLRAWIHSPAASKAVWHACRVLSLSLHGLQSVDDPAKGICEFWNLYISTLVCWAFGHRHSSNGNLSALSAALAGGHGASSLSSVTSSRRSSVTLASTADDFIARKKTALAYVDHMLALPYEELHNSLVRSETGAVLDAARLRLESEAVGCRCGLLVDGALVLGRLSREGRMLF